VIEIEWESAEVDGGTLTVKLSEAASKEWRDRAAGVAEVLAERGRGRWGDVKVKKDTIRVAGLSEGEESDVRHFLESVVLEANSVLGGDDEDGDDEGEPSGDDEVGEDGDTPDRRMTDAFRSFR
jgi:hypothetical protein